MLVLAGIALVIGGCSGSGTVQTVPWMRKDLPATEPLLQTVPVNEAYYAIEEDGTVTVALRYQVPSLLGKVFDADWQMSVVVEGLPAGSERLYRLRQQSARIYQSVGGVLRRSRSWSGIAVLHAPDAGRLKGRFHLTARQQQYNILTGWTAGGYRAPLMVIVGEFEAVRDDAQAQTIREVTEDDGFERTPIGPATSGPQDSPGIIQPIRLPSTTATQPG